MDINHFCLCHSDAGLYGNHLVNILRTICRHTEENDDNIKKNHVMKDFIKWTEVLKMRFTA